MGTQALETAPLSHKAPQQSTRLGPQHMVLTSRAFRLCLRSASYWAKQVTGRRAGTGHTSSGQASILHSHIAHSHRVSQLNHLTGHRRSTTSFKRKLFGQADGAEVTPDLVSQHTEDTVRVHPLSRFRNGWDSTTLGEQSVLPDHIFPKLCQPTLSLCQTTRSKQRNAPAHAAVSREMALLYGSLSNLSLGLTPVHAVLVAFTVVVLPFRAAFISEFYRQLDMHHHLWQQLQVGQTRPVPEPSAIILSHRPVYSASSCALLCIINAWWHALPMQMPELEGRHHVQVDWMLSMDLIVDLFFLADGVLNFHTGVIIEHVSNTLARSMAKVRDPESLPKSSMKQVAWTCIASLIAVCHPQPALGAACGYVQSSYMPMRGRSCHLWSVFFPAAPPCSHHHNAHQSSL